MDKIVLGWCWESQEKRRVVKVRGGQSKRSKLLRQPGSMAVAGCVIVNQSREAHVEMFPARWRRRALAGVTSITSPAT